MSAPTATGASPPSGSGRQQERSRATQTRLLQATVDCLVEHGWAGTTTTVVAPPGPGCPGAPSCTTTRPGSALVIAAVDHLARRRTEDLRAEAAALPVGPHRLDRLIDTHALLTSWKRQLAIIIRT